MSASLPLSSPEFSRLSSPTLVVAAAISVILHGAWLLDGQTAVAINQSGGAQSAVAVSLTHLTHMERSVVKPATEPEKTKAMKNAAAQPKVAKTSPSSDLIAKDSALPASELLEQSSIVAEPEQVKLTEEPLAATSPESSALNELAVNDSPPMIRKNPNFSRPPTPPKYPAIAIKRRWQGQAIIHALIDEQGHAVDLVVKHSTGFTILDRSALDAVAGWSFQPTIEYGRKIASWVEVPVEFSLRR